MYTQLYDTIGLAMRGPAMRGPAMRGPEMIENITGPETS